MSKKLKFPENNREVKRLTDLRYYVYVDKEFVKIVNLSELSDVMYYEEIQHTRYKYPCVSFYYENSLKLFSFRKFTNHKKTLFKFASPLAYDVISSQSRFMLFEHIHEAVECVIKLHAYDMQEINKLNLAINNKKIRLNAIDDILTQYPAFAI